MMYVIGRCIVPVFNFHAHFQGKYFTMKKMITLLCIVTLFFSVTGFGLLSNKEVEIPYPEGYRMWTHIKTTLVGPANPNFKMNGGYHHIYANAKAMEGYTSGYFPEGSMLVFDVISFTEAIGVASEAGRKYVDVMLKDSLQYASTGGWGYEEFKGDSHTERLLTPTLKTQCAGCHAQKEDKVFSEFRK